MKSVRLRKPLILSALKTLVAFFLIIMLAACGSNSAATSAPAQPHASNTVFPVPNAILSLSPTNISITAGNLLIQSYYGLQCPYPGPGKLVFTSDPTTYTQAEIAQIHTYINTAWVHSNFSPSSTPPTLRWVLGGPAQRISDDYLFCGVSIILTNTGYTSIQIPKVGIQLQGQPQKNTYQYHLINICSVLDPNQVLCPPGGGADTECSRYFATIQLGLGEKNSVFSAVPRAMNRLSGGDCGILTLAPAAQVYLSLNLSSAPNTPDNLLYSVNVVFTVHTAQGEHSLELPQLGKTLAFADANQFSCYGLQGTRFVLINPPFPESSWCA